MQSEASKQSRQHLSILGDCLTAMPDLARNSVDLILTDPPYGATLHAWDRDFKSEETFACFRRVLKPNGLIVVTAIQPFASFLINENLDLFKYEMIWHKTMPTMFQHANRRPLRIHELILVFGHGQGTYNPQFGKRAKPYTKLSGDRKASGFHTQAIKHSPKVNREHVYPTDVVRFANPNRNRLHPTQKPVDLMKYLILTYSNPGEIVLDPFMGSGSTAEAAYLTGRAFIGIEKDLHYFDKACERMNKVIKEDQIHDHATTDASANKP